MNGEDHLMDFAKVGYGVALDTELRFLSCFQVNASMYHFVDCSSVGYIYSTVMYICNAKESVIRRTKIITFCGCSLILRVIVITGRHFFVLQNATLDNCTALLFFQAVHSGADLESAIATCMGYKAEVTFS